MAGLLLADLRLQKYGYFLKKVLVKVLELPTLSVTVTLSSHSLVFRILSSKL